VDDRRIHVSWACPACEVGGQDPEPEDAETGPACWNCGGPVVVTARPTVFRWTGPDAA
jgi:DNA-directed RNA polymerase subunit RPC12/RpoP